MTQDPPPLPEARGGAFPRNARAAASRLRMPMPAPRHSRHRPGPPARLRRPDAARAGRRCGRRAGRAPIRARHRRPTRGRHRGCSGTAMLPASRWAPPEYRRSLPPRAVLATRLQGMSVPSRTTCPRPCSWRRARTRDRAGVRSARTVMPSCGWRWPVARKIPASRAEVGTSVPQRRPAHHRHGLAERAQRPGTARGADPAAMGGRQPGQVAPCQDGGTSSMARWGTGAEPVGSGLILW